MDKLTFENRLIEASRRILDFTPQFISNPLPVQCRYFIYPNSSYDEGYGSIGNDEERFPEDSKIGVIGPVEASEVVSFLWRNGRIPQWIDINVQSTDSEYTYIRLVCCGRFVGESRRLYHENKGLPPFQCLGPRMPLDWVPGDNAKFDINKYLSD